MVDEAQTHHIIEKKRYIDNAPTFVGIYEMIFFTKYITYT